MDVFKLEQNLMLSGVVDTKVSPSVTFDTNADFNISFFESPPRDVKKEIDFDERAFDVSSDQIFSPADEYFSNEDSKYSFSDGNPFNNDSSSSTASPNSTPGMSSPLPSPGVNQSHSGKSPLVIKSECGYPGPDSTPSAASKNLQYCKVCGDKASGYHYGVTSCEGCKGFFRRSIQKQIEYRCLREAKCVIIRLNRNRCQYCRFKKCISVGMSRDSVRYGRVPRRTRERQNSSESRSPLEANTLEANTDATSESQQIATFDLILTISHAHHATCSYTEDKVRSLSRKPIICSTNGSSDPETATSTADALEQQKLNLWKMYAIIFTPTVQKSVEFAKRLPGFCEMSQDDQLVLIKSGFFELWLTGASRLISPTENTVTFADGSYFTRHQLEILFDQEFATSIFSFASSVNHLALNDTEIALFSAVVLLTSERPGVRDQKAVEQLQDKVVEALRVQLTKSHPNDTHLFTSLAMKLPELKHIGQRNHDHLNWFRVNYNRVKVPPLFSEIYDIPKYEDERL